MAKRIAIHSVPRSGSTWLGTIFNSHPNVVYKYQPLFSYRLKGYLTPDSSKEEILEFFSKLENTSDDFMDQVEAKERNIVPEFEKDKEVEAIVYKEVRYHHVLRNLLEKDPEVKVIGLIRNPISTIYSWYNAPREFRKDLGWDIMEEWKDAPSKNQGKPEEFNGFEKWKEVAILFEELELEFGSRFKKVFYGDLLSDTENMVKNIFEFSGLTFSSQTQAFLGKSRSKNVQDAYSVYRKKETDLNWVGNFDTSIIEAIKSDLKNSSLEQYLR